MMTLFAVPVFDATVTVERNELFKGNGSALHWADRLAVEIGSEVGVRGLSKNRMIVNENQRGPTSPLQR